ncbi:MAG: hypothetical protein ACYCW6_01145 [Candidatus Xenobia bacterium]
MAVLPLKVRSGELGPETIVFKTTTEETMQVPLSTVRCLFLGRIDPPTRTVETKAGAGSGALKLVGNIIAPGVGGLLASGVNKATGVGKTTTTSGGSSYYVMDLHCDNYDGPFRIESTGTNMRTFLGEEAGYSGEINMMLLLKKLAPYIPTAFNKQMVVVLERGKTNAPSFPDRDEFGEASYKAYLRLRGAEPEEPQLSGWGE